MDIYKWMSKVFKFPFTNLITQSPVTVNVRGSFQFWVRLTFMIDVILSSHVDNAQTNDRLQNDNTGCPWSVREIACVDLLKAGSSAALT